MRPESCSRKNCALAAECMDGLLTCSEKHILELMSEGMTKKEIAGAIQLSVHTVNFHLRRTYEKLDVHTNTGAVAAAIRQKLI